MITRVVSDRSGEPAQRSGQWRSERGVILLLIATPLLGALAAIAWIWTRGLDFFDLALFVGFYLWTGLGITVGYHRLFTHRAFQAASGLRLVLAIAGAMAIQGPAYRWVADHRRHHAHADAEGDPHSPYLVSLWHAHVGWLFSEPEQRTELERYAPDILADPLLAFVDRRYVLWVALSLGLPALLGGLYGGPRHALSTFLIAGLARICALQNVTWCVNSICHRFGARPFRTPDQSRNNAIVALLALGEGWHNNHHAFPSAAHHGLCEGQRDLSYGVIRGLERLGLVWSVREVTARELAARRRS